MDLERLMIEWQKQEFEGYLFETPPGEIAAAIRREDEKRKRKHRLRSYAGIVLLVVLAAATVLAVSLEHSLMARAATLLLMAAISHELVWMLKWRAEEYGKPYSPRMKQPLLDERKRVERQMRWIKWQIAWRFVGGGAGLAYMFLSEMMTGEEDVIDFCIGFLVALLVIHFFYLLGRRRELPQTRERLDRLLRQFDVLPEP